MSVKFRGCVVEKAGRRLFGIEVKAGGNAWIQLCRLAGDPMLWTKKEDRDQVLDAKKRVYKARNAGGAR